MWQELQNNTRPTQPFRVTAPDTGHHRTPATTTATTTTGILTRK